MAKLTAARRSKTLPSQAPKVKKTGEASPADKRQDAAMRKRTGMTQAQVEASPADRKADTARTSTRGARPKAADHLSMAAHHRAMADAHRDAADKHVAKAVDAAAKSIGGMKPGSKDGMAMTVNYGGMSTPGLAEAVRSVTQAPVGRSAPLPSQSPAVARTRTRK